MIFIKTRGTKISDNNMMTLCGHIQNFFNKPIGIVKENGEIEPVKYSCHEHLLHKMYRNGEYCYTYAFLQVESSVGEKVFTICKNSRIFITGNRMVITNHVRYITYNYIRAEVPEDGKNVIYTFIRL